jgi:hypothetical protein
MRSHHRFFGFVFLVITALIAAGGLSGCVIVRPPMDTVVIPEPRRSPAQIADDDDTPTPVQPERTPAAKRPSH